MKWVFAREVVKGQTILVREGEPFTVTSAHTGRMPPHSVYIDGMRGKVRCVVTLHPGQVVAVLDEPQETSAGQP